MTLNVLSLFSGIGGLRPLELGLERAGMTVVGQVEIDEFCRRVLAKHWPEVPRHDDVRTCVEWWGSEPRPPVDVVAGGFPCQPVSVAGERLGQEDPRWLWPAVDRIIGALRPAWVLLENVPGLLSRGMGDVLGDLAESGYDATWDCIPAAAVGAPHRRDRVFVVAYPGGLGRWEGPGQLGRLGIAERGQDVADTDSVGRVSGRHDAGQPEVSEPVDRSPLGNPEGVRRDLRPGSGEAGTWPGQPPRVFVAEPRDAGWWGAEPDVGRVAHGVPARVDRLRALGNAVVPQVAEHIGRLVMGAAS